MRNTKMLTQGAINALAAVAYIAAVAGVMSNAENIFGPGPDDIRAPILFLMMFVFSALVMGLLFLGMPVMLFLDGKKKEAITLLTYTAASFFILLIITFLLIVMI